MIINAEYFFSPAGKTNPKQELKANIQAFQKVLPVTDAHPQCRFPARYNMLKTEFTLAPPVACPRIATWMNSYKPSHMSLVYATQYISNPASIFGHIFLIGESQKQAEGFWLSFNYAAGIPKTTSGLGYIWGGLTGWFEGDYSILPYYQRLIQYGDIENRDMWSFRLRMSDKERNHLLNHLWELVHQAKFKYFFMDENCAGILLRTFATVFPEMKDESNLNFYVSPLAVVKSLKKFNRLEKVTKILSRFNTVKEKLAQLSRSDKNKFYSSIANPDKPIDHLNTPTTEAIIEYLSYLTHKGQGTLPEEFAPLERASYIQRASQINSIHIKTPPIQIDETPAMAHNPSMASLGYSHLNESSVADFGYRFVMHDQLDPETGFLKNSAVEALNIQLSTNGNELWLKKMDLIKIENIRPIYKFSPQFSWRIKWAVEENLYTENKIFDNYGLIDGAVGGAHQLSSHLVTFLLASSALHMGSGVLQNDIEIGPEVGLIFSKNKFKSIVRFRWLTGLFSGGDKSERMVFSSGFRYSISEDISLIQQTHWSKLLSTGSEPHRIDLGLRFYF